MPIETRLISSLEKVFPSTELNAKPVTQLEAAGGECVAFQLATRCHANLRFRVIVDSPIKQFVTVREVRNVPCDYPAHPDDTFAISATPGLFPDALIPADDTPQRYTFNFWQALWISVKIPAGYTPGDYPITVSIVSDSPSTLPWPQGNFEAPKETLTLRVLPFDLPKQRLLSINWFYADCIAKYYNLEPWSEPLWNMLEKYFVNMAEHGNNILYTPLWSVPLDTGKGWERPTVQLLDISEANGCYSVNFDNLKRWIETARKAGIERFELAHMFTQWGAHATPKIIVNGEKRFGWHVPSASPVYEDFLKQILPQLTQFLKEQGLAGKCYFHISDEPNLHVLESYKAASQLIRQFVNEDDFPIIDALSEVEFYQLGLIKRPIPVTATVDRFANEPIEERWVYYCGNWQHCLPNRNLGMPSIRSRIMGILLYLYKMDGFLHWGYNFWFTQFSLNQNISPWQVTCAGRAHLGGDSFNVYPGPEGPIDSIHFETFTEGLQDLRALDLLETKIGRDKVVAIIQKDVNYTIDMRHYPHDDQWLLNLRKRINEAICMN